jgi:hypothetical protein
MSRLAFIEAHELGAFGDLTDTVMSTLNSAVKAIRIESAWGPKTRITDPFSPSPPGQTSVLGPFLKPKITLEMKSGWGGNRSIAPYGDPGPSKFPFLVAGVIALAALAYVGNSYRRR